MSCIPVFGRHVLLQRHNVKYWADLERVGKTVSAQQEAEAEREAQRLKRENKRRRKRNGSKKGGHDGRLKRMTKWFVGSAGDGEGDGAREARDSRPRNGRGRR